MSQRRGKWGGKQRPREEQRGSHLLLTTLSLSWVPRAGWGAPIPMWGGFDLEGR